VAKGKERIGMNKQRSHNFIWRGSISRSWYETVQQLFIDLKKTYDPLRRVLLYNILMGFEAPMKLKKLIKCI
jgi:hypothetical protein